MSVSEAQLLEAIETSLFLMPEIPGLLTHVNIPGLMGRYTDVSHPLANMVGAARLETPERADQVIRQVCDLFEGLGASFGWVTGPSDSPKNLRARLEAAGLVKAAEMAGMVLTDLDLNISSNPDAEIRELTQEDEEGAIALFSIGFEMPHDVSRLFFKAVRASDKALSFKGYLAFLDGVERPVAGAFSGYLPDAPIFLLGGAATLPEYRERGLYTSLVKKRIEDARKAGYEAAVIQALRTTSAPICRKLGLKEVCGLEHWVKLPAAQNQEPEASA